MSCCGYWWVGETRAKDWAAMKLKLPRVVIGLGVGMMLGVLAAGGCGMRQSKQGLIAAGDVMAGAIVEADLFRPDLPERVFESCDGGMESKLAKLQRRRTMEGAGGNVEEGAERWSVLAETQEKKGWVRQTRAYFERSSPTAPVGLMRVDDYNRGTVTVLEPPIVLLGGLNGEERSCTASVWKMRDPASAAVLGGVGSQQPPQSIRRVDGGPAVATSGVVGEGRVMTVLTIKLSSSTVRQERVYTLQRGGAGAGELVREEEHLQVTVGPLRVVNRESAWCLVKPE